MDSTRGRQRFRSVEGARGLAAAGVLIYHAGVFSPGHSGMQSATSRGWLGVPLFFLLSGLLLFQPFARAIVHRTSWPSLPRYARSRLLRIFPGYWVALSVSILVSMRQYQTWVLAAAAAAAFAWAWLARRPPHLGVLLAVVAAPLVATDPWWFPAATNYLLAWIPFGPEEWMGVSWTLCIEISFYLALPAIASLLAFAVRRLTSKPAAAAAVAAVPLLATPALSWWFVSTVGPTNQLALALPAFLDQFAIGMLLALLLEIVPRGKARRLGRVMLATGVAIAAVANTWLFAIGPAAPYGNGSGMLFVRLMAVAFALLLGSVLLAEERSWLGRVLAARPLVWAGTVSYGLYLWHPFVIDVLRRTTWWGNAGLDMLMVAVGACVCASVSWFAVERPALRLKERPAAARTASRAPVLVD